MSVLIGTYRGKNLDWIRRENYYNLPIVGAPRDDGFSDISHVILIAKEHPVIAYEATATEVVDQKWLKSKKYSVLLKKPHGEKYQLFKLCKACSWQELLLDATKDIYVWTASFSGKITADFYRKTLPKLGDWSAAYILNKIKPYIKGRKNVFAVATQDDFFELLKTKRQENVPFPSPKNPKFRFIDLFAGIGGFRLAMQEFGGECVFSSEWDKNAQETYVKNYGETPYGDITKQSVKDAIPDQLDVLCGGFPCQAFSNAGLKKGFDDTRGTLFFDIMQIVRMRKPKVLFLENVRNLVGHDGGKTFKVIKESIESEGYSFNYKVIDASPLVPQKRLRCYMVCVRDKGKFKFPTIRGKEKKLKSILEENVSDSYTISDGLWAGHQRRTKANLARGTGFTAFTADVEKPAHTLVARYYKDGKECLVPQQGKNPRMLTPRECARLQGFPETFILPKAKSKAYKQMGNSVAVPVLKRIARNIFDQILKEGR